MDFESLRRKFFDFYEAVKASHKRSEQAHRGHGLDHDITVAQIAVKIAPDTRTAEKAWCAAMIHSIDHLAGSKGRTEVLARALLEFLPNGYFSLEEIEEIFQAAYRHGELNQADQSVTQQVLMDADRVVNMMLTLLIRCGQFHPDIPPFDFQYLNGRKNPESTYHSRLNVLDSIRCNMTEYLPQIRIPKAREIAQRYAGHLELYVRMLEDQHKELGLVGISL